MKQIFQIIGVGICSSLLLVGCVTTTGTTKTTYSYSEYRSVQPSQSVATAPLIADLVVSEKRITYAERINTVITNMSSSEAKALADKEKETVIANAVKTNKADVLVAPIIDIQTDSNGYLVIEVTGYPASYKNFRNASKDDMWIMEKNQTPKAHHDSNTSEEKKTAMPIGLPSKK